MEERHVTLVVSDDAGRVLGALPAFSLTPPWWQEVGPVVAAARERFGLDVCILRLLHSERPRAHGGGVTYLAELAPGARPSATVFSPLEARVLELATREHPLRAAWAELGGPQRSLTWAEGELAARGFGPCVAVQERSWNLSAIWRLNSAGGTRPPFWLKQVPEFFAHEGALLGWLDVAAPGFVPVLIADDGHGRLLLDHVVGVDCHDARVQLRAVLGKIVHEIQQSAAAKLPTLLGLRIPDRRGTALAHQILDVLGGTRLRLDSPGLSTLLATLEQRCEALAACGIPDTLVHGDLHPGNAREHEGRVVIIDWGDSFIGHPGFDILRLAEGCSESEAGSLIDQWSARWRRARPGSDPERAIELLRPLAALRAAATYAHFLSRNRAE